MLRSTLGQTPFSARWLTTFVLGTAALIACGGENPSDDDDGSGNGSTSSATGGATGTGGGASASGSGAGAGGSVDEECVTGVAAFCFCVENAGEPACTSQQQEDYYGVCTAGSDNGFLECVG